MLVDQFNVLTLQCTVLKFCNTSSDNKSEENMPCFLNNAGRCPQVVACMCIFCLVRVSTKLQSVKHGRVCGPTGGPLYTRTDSSSFTPSALPWGYLYTVKPLITDPLKSRQPLYSRWLTCPRLILA